MHLKDLLDQVPGANRRFVYYLEAQGYIQPIRIQKERIARRDYSPEDVKVVRETWKYYRRGFSLQAAHNLGVTQKKVTCYITFKAPPRRWREVLERLKGLPEVVEASAVYADSADFVVRSSTPQEADVYHALAPLFVETGVMGVPALMKAEEEFVRSPRPKQRRKVPPMMAYVLINVPVKNVADITATLKTYDEIVEVSTVYGELDIIARAIVANQHDLDTLVMERIHSIPAVQSTRTYIVVGDMHWERDSS